YQVGVLLCSGKPVAPSFLPGLDGALHFFQGWKIHLATNRPSEVNHKLSQLGLPRKVSSPHDEDLKGKNVTVYIGSRDEVEIAATRISQELGQLLTTPYGLTLRHDVEIERNIMGRFNIHRIDRGFLKYGMRGVPFSVKAMEQKAKQGKLNDLEINEFIS